MLRARLAKGDHSPQRVDARENLPGSNHGAHQRLRRIIVAEARGGLDGAQLEGEVRLREAQDSLPCLGGEQLAGQAPVSV